MSMPGLRLEAWHEPEAELPASRPVSALAVVTVILGVLSLLAFFDWALLVFPLITVVVAVIAWRQLYQYDPPAIGEGGIKFALLLAAFGGIGGPVRLYTLRQFLVTESRPWADQFLSFLCQDKPHLAFQLSRGPDVRLPVQESAWSRLEGGLEARDKFIWESIGKENMGREEFEGFVNRPAVRMVIRLGGQAQIRYLGAPAVEQRQGRHQVHHLYAFTYDHEGKRRSVLVSVQLERQRLRDSRRADWTVVDVFGPVDPTAYR